MALDRASNIAYISLYGTSGVDKGAILKVDLATDTYIYWNTGLYPFNSPGIISWDEVGRQLFVADGSTDYSTPATGGPRIQTLQVDTGVWTAMPANNPQLMAYDTVESRLWYTGSYSLYRQNDAKTGFDVVYNGFGLERCATLHWWCVRISVSHSLPVAYLFLAVFSRIFFFRYTTCFGGGMRANGGVVYVAQGASNTLTQLRAGTNSTQYSIYTSWSSIDQSVDGSQV